MRAAKEADELAIMEATSEYKNKVDNLRNKIEDLCSDISELLDFQLFWEEYCEECGQEFAPDYNGWGENFEELWNYIHREKLDI